MAVPSPSPSGQLDGAAPRPRRNYALDILRIVSIVGVVAIHSFGELAGDDDARSQPDWLPAAIIDIAFIWVVPVFVTISGALVLAPRAHAEGARAADQSGRCGCCPPWWYGIWSTSSLAIT